MGSLLPRHTVALLQDNAEYFSQAFEIGRRHKILNPESMRTGMEFYDRFSVADCDYKNHNQDPTFGRIEQFQVFILTFDDQETIFEN